MAVRMLSLLTVLRWRFYDWASSLEKSAVVNQKQLYSLKFHHQVRSLATRNHIRSFPSTT